MERKLEITYAPTGLPEASLPIRCRSVSRSVLPPGERSQFVAKEYWHASWVTAGRGVLRLTGEDLPVRAGDCLVVPPDTRRQASATTAALVSRGVSFVGPAVCRVLAGFGIEGVFRRAGVACPETELLRLEREICDLSRNGLCVASATLYQALALSFAGGRGGAEAAPPLVREALGLIAGHLSDPALNVDWLARRVDSHRSHLSRCFKAHTGLAPSAFIQQRRLQQAMQALAGGRCPVGQIARACGFESPEYFCRVFRREVGQTPGSFRRDARG